jgi:SMODS and SLOG-associating 2TM effector domain 1
MATLMQTDMNLAALDEFTGPIPPQGAAAQGDDGMSPLTPRRYITVRVDDQLDFYRSKVRQLDRTLRRLRWAILAFGGLGTFLAAVGLELWIALTTALVGAFTTYLEAEQVENSLMLYNQAATDLSTIRVVVDDASSRRPGRPEERQPAGRERRADYAG